MPKPDYATDANKNRMRLPSTLPLGQRCVRVFVPDDDDYVGYLLGALSRLTKQVYYDRDEAKTAREVAYLWKQAYQRTVSNIDGCGCEFPDDAVCTEYSTQAPFLQWTPHDPWQQPNLTPPGYSSPLWRTDPNSVENIFGLQQGDVFFEIDSILNILDGKPLSALTDLGLNAFPSVSFAVFGEGQIEIELIKLPQAGLAYVDVDVPLLGGQVVDLKTLAYSDIIDATNLLGTAFGSPFGSGFYQTETVEVNVMGAGQHDVRITFVPRLNLDEVEDIFFLLAFGGGLRRISFCGFDQVGGAVVPEFRTINDGCTLQWRPSPLSAWETLADDICGDEGPIGPVGAPAPTPDVRVTPQLGGESTIVEFDMDGDGTYETGFSVFNGQDGADGTPAPTPDVRITPQLGGESTIVEFDMDADGTYETGFSVFNGQDGADGQDGEDGEDGECPDCGVPEVITDGLTDNDYCAIAYYNSEKFTSLMLVALDELVFAGTFLTWAEVVEAYFYVGIAVSLEDPINYPQNGERWRTAYDIIAGYQQEEIEIIKAELPFLRDALRNEIFCSRNVTKSAAFAAQFATQSFSIETATVYYSVMDALSTDVWRSWSNFALIDNRDVDCSQIDCQLGLQGLADVSSVPFTLAVPAEYNSSQGSGLVGGTYNFQLNKVTPHIESDDNGTLIARLAVQITLDDPKPTSGTIIVEFDQDIVSGRLLPNTSFPSMSAGFPANKRLPGDVNGPEIGAVALEFNLAGAIDSAAWWYYFQSRLEGQNGYGASIVYVRVLDTS